MMTFLRRHWLVLLVLAVACFIGVQWCSEAQAKERENKRADAAETEAAQWRGKAIADSIRTEEWKAVAARADTVYLTAVDTFTVRETRWLTLPDTASVETVRAVADTTIRACRSALDACAIARAADADVVFGLETVNADLRGELMAVREANDALRDAGEGGTILWDLLAVGGGCGVGYALRGLRGCAEGAAGGAVLTIGYRGVRSLLEDLR